MRMALAVLECTSNEFLQKCETPHIDGLENGPCPALSPGLASRPTIAANLAGVVAQCYCDDRDCTNKKIKWGNPFFIDNMRKRTNVDLRIGNGWVFDIIRQYLTDQQMAQHMTYMQFENLPSLDMLEHFEDRDLDDFYLHMHIPESHPPFSHPFWYGTDVEKIRTSDTLPDAETRRRMSVEWIDEKIISRLLSYDLDALIVTSDHDFIHLLPVLDGWSADPSRPTYIYDEMGLKSKKDIGIGHEAKVFIASEFRDESLLDLWGDD